MDGSTQCILPKLPIVRRNVTTNLGGFISLPAPCWTIGALPLVYVYFLIGLSITMILIVFGQLEFLRDLFAGRLRKPAWCCGRQSANVNDNDSKAEVAKELGVEKPAVDRLVALSEAKARRSIVSKFFAEAASAQTFLGQILMFIGILCSATSLGIYLHSVSKRLESLELCGTMPNLPQILDVSVNSYLLFYYIIRVVGSEKRPKTVSSFFSVVDYFTIPGVLIGASLNRDFTGFSFFRAYNLMWFVDIIAYRRIIHSVNVIRILKLIVLVFAIILIAAGFLHAAENLGDPWLSDPDGTLLYNGQSIVFWRCFLYVYGRITLLDLSGMRMHTMMGKVIIYGFQILALGIVGQAIPQIIARLKIKPDYDKSFEGSNMFIHIVVCGHVTAQTMQGFLDEFYHPDRDSSEFFKIVILSEQKPDEDMETLQERYFSKLDYYRGTVMDIKDLNRVKLAEAKATLILADRTAPDSDADDAANIMRVVSIKNYKDDAQIIVQLSQYHNKAYLQNIPSWNEERGDIVICLAELRLGLLAQSCNAPGFSTLMANFFTTRSFDTAKANIKGEEWMQHYRRGTALELYCRAFSDAFDGMTYSQACEFCYAKLKIVLLAIQIDPNDPASIPQINPPPHVTIDCARKTVGYFICDDTTQVNRAQFYCTKCHLGVEELDQIKKCNCNKGQPLNAFARQTSQILSRTYSSFQDLDLTIESKIWSYINNFDRSPKSQSLENIPNLIESENVPRKSEYKYDSTGMFYWVPGRPIDAVTINRKKAATTQFSNHIVVCVLSHEKSQICGLSSFVLPLRSSVIKPEDLRDILLLCDPKYLEKEWKYLYNLPKLYVVKGTALNRSDLRSVNLNTCRMCVILGAPTAVTDKNNDPTMIDKSVILATLNVRAMKFSHEECPGYSKETHPKEGESAKSSEGNNADKSHQKRRKSSLSMKNGYDVPLITDLMRDSNVQFLDDQDDDLPGTEFYLAQPYATGRAFTASVLDLLMVTCFFNPTIIKSVHTIVFGGASLELERIMAEGAGLIGGDNISKPAENKDQVSVQQLSVKSGPLSIHVGSPYGGLFIDALRTLGLVVLGIYRRIQPGSSKRFVICNPPETFVVQGDDEIYALCRANSVIQPPLRTALSSKNTRRILDSADVVKLEKNLQSINQDVVNMEQRYQNIVEKNEEMSPLLDDSVKSYQQHPASSFPQLERREMDEELRIMEEKLAKMKQDVAVMQERYIKFAFGDYV